MVDIITNDIFKQLKKHHGEKCAQIIRDAGLLDIPGILDILEFAGNNPDDFKDLVPVIHHKFTKLKQQNTYATKTPLQLLNEAGYDAFVVETLEQQNSIEKYFRQNEKLCTFRDSNRYKNYYMIHAVKHNADKIKPFPNPQRQDEYGTSVISIQIAKKGGFISIKNRYNHSVNNSNSTFDNNPDNIISGLTASLQKYFNVDFHSCDLKLPDNYIFVGDKIIKYNYEIDNVYFGSNFYFKDGKIIKLNPDYEIMLDWMILNKKAKTITSPIQDDTLTVFESCFNNKTIYENTNGNKKIIHTDDNNQVVVIDGKIIELTLPTIIEIGNRFLNFNTALTSVNLPKLTKTGDDFLLYNEALTSVNLPGLTETGNGFLFYNEYLTSVNLPKLIKTGYGFLNFNTALTSVNLPELTETGDGFLFYNKYLTSVNLPKLIKTGYGFLKSNTALTSVNLPELTETGDGFLYWNKVLTSINLPKLIKTGNDFLCYNEALTSVNLPKLTKTGNDFLRCNKALTSVNLPELTETGDGFLFYNEYLTSVNLPKLPRDKIARIYNILKQNQIKNYATSRIRQ